MLTLPVIFKRSNMVVCWGEVVKTMPRSGWISGERPWWKTQFLPRWKSSVHQTHRAMAHRWSYWCPLLYYTHDSPMYNVKENNQRGMLGCFYNNARDVHRRDEELLSYVLTAVSPCQHMWHIWSFFQTPNARLHCDCIFCVKSFVWFALIHPGLRNQVFLLQSFELESFLYMLHWYS